MRFDLPFFRAKRAGGGVVVIAQHRDGNTFLQSGAQSGPMTANGGAPFNLKSPDQSITVKLGLPDLGALIAAYRAVRLANGPVPEKIRSYSSDPNRDVSMSMGLVHKYQPRSGPGGAPAAPQSKTISWAFNEAGSHLGIGNGRLRQSVPLGPSDEVQLVMMLERALVLTLEFAGATRQATFEATQLTDFTD